MDIEAILGCPPRTTYLGGRYVDDLCQFSDVSFSRQGELKAHLTFIQSGFSQKDFHFSAVQVQRLVPYLCQELLQKILAPQQQVETASLLKTEQQFLRYVTASQNISCRIKCLQQQGNTYHFEYEVSTPLGKPAFSGTMQFLVRAKQREQAWQEPSALMPETYQQVYSLQQVGVKGRTLTADFFPEGKADPIQTHAATAQLLRLLFCSLFGLRRQDIIQARAYSLQQLYRPEAPAATTIALEVDPHVLVAKQKRSWLFLICRYEIRNYVEGLLKVACPYPSSTRSQEQKYRELFTFSQTSLREMWRR